MIALLVICFTIEVVDYEIYKTSTDLPLETYLVFDTTNKILYECVNCGTPELQRVGKSEQFQAAKKDATKVSAAPLPVMAAIEKKFSNLAT